MSQSKSEMMPTASLTGIQRPAINRTWLKSNIGTHATQEHKCNVLGNWWLSSGVQRLVGATHQQEKTAWSPPAQPPGHGVSSQSRVASVSSVMTSLLLTLSDNMNPNFSATLQKHSPWPAPWRLDLVWPRINQVQVPSGAQVQQFWRWPLVLKLLAGQNLEAWHQATLCPWVMLKSWYKLRTWAINSIVAKQCAPDPPLEHKGMDRDWQNKNKTLGFIVEYKCPYGFATQRNLTCKRISTVTGTLRKT